MKKKILIIEDDYNEFDKLINRLYKEDYEFIPEHDPNHFQKMIDALNLDGIKKYIEDTIQLNYKDLRLIICDIRLRHNASIQGFELIKYIRNKIKVEKFEKFANRIPIIAYTHLGDKETAKNALEAGADYYIHKEAGEYIQTVIDIFSDKFTYWYNKSVNQKRFKIGFSFAGENREFVNKVAIDLAIEYSKYKIFYDFFHKAELARLDLDNYLQNIYSNDCEYIAVFISENYESRDWCGLEWRAIKEIIKDKQKKQSKKIILVKFDKTDLKGIFSFDGFIDASNMEAEDVSKLILERIKLDPHSPSFEP